MNAVIVTGGKQYRVAEGQLLKVEKLVGLAGDAIEFSQVLLISDGEAINIGTPLVTGAIVGAEIVSQGRAKKIDIIKFRRRKHHMKHMGHRQDFTEVKITGIKTTQAAAKKRAAAKVTHEE